MAGAELGRDAVIVVFQQSVSACRGAGRTSPTGVPDDPPQAVSAVPAAVSAAARITFFVMIFSMESFCWINYTARSRLCKERTKKTLRSRRNGAAR